MAVLLLFGGLCGPAMAMTETGQEETVETPESATTTNADQEGSVTDASSSEGQGTNPSPGGATAPLTEESAPAAGATVRVVPHLGEVEVGDSARFQIYLALSGQQREYKNQVLTVQLPVAINGDSISFTQGLEQLQMRGVTPTYSREDNTLTYTFPSLMGGSDSSVFLEIATANGAPLDGEVLEVEARMSGEQIGTVTDSATVTLRAAESASLSNKFLGIDKDGQLVERSSFRYQDDAVFGVGLSVNRNASGSLSVLPGSDITLSYTLAKGLTYQSDTSGITPVQSGQTLTWTLPGDLGADDEYYFATQFRVTATVTEDLPYFSKLDNVASAQITYANGETIPYQAVSTTMIAPNFEAEVPPILDGFAYSSVFSGPADGSGGMGWINNDDPMVTDGSLLAWRFYMSSLSATHPHSGLSSYDWFFLPDQHLNLQKMYSGDFYYRPSSAFAEAGLQPMEEPIHYSISIKYADSAQWEQGLADVTPSKWYSSEDLGIDSQRKVEALWMHFHNNVDDIFTTHVNETVFGLNRIPAGLTSTNLSFFTTVDEGYVGSVASNAAVSYAGWGADGYAVGGTSKNTPVSALEGGTIRNPLNSTYESRLSTKTAQIVAPAEGPERYVRAQASLETARDNLIDSGPNRLLLQLSNDSASQHRLNGPFAAYALLDSGIEVAEDVEAEGATVTVVDRDFRGSGKTLLQLTYWDSELTVGFGTVVKIPVRVLENAPYNVGVQFMGFLNEDFDVATTSNVDGTFTEKRVDSDDLNGNGNTTEAIYSTRKMYTHAAPYDYYGAIFASTSGAGVSEHVELKPDETAKVTLSVRSLKHNPFSTLQLIGVLPTVGDTRVLSDETRDSRFNVTLTGPLSLPEGLEDSFEVFYSESSEPSVAGVLDKNVGAEREKLTEPSNVADKGWVIAKDVKSFADIRAFMIVKTDATAPIYSDAVDFALTLKPETDSLSGEESVADRSAFLSFAAGVNDAQVFETSSFPLIFMKDKVSPAPNPTGPSTPGGNNPGGNNPGGNNQGNSPAPGSGSHQSAVPLASTGASIAWICSAAVGFLLLAVGAPLVARKLRKGAANDD